MQLTYSAEIEAIRTDAGFSKPVVALESTIITHGMPYPQNLDVARAVEQEVRDAGAVPATIAILNGSLHIGLDPEQLTDLAQARDVAKVSRADMAFVMAQGKSGATTVAATMIQRRRLALRCSPQEALAGCTAAQSSPLTFRQICANWHSPIRSSWPPGPKPF